MVKHYKMLLVLVMFIYLSETMKLVDRVVPKSRKSKIVDASSYAEAYAEYMKEYSEVEDQPVAGWAGAADYENLIKQQVKHKRNFVHELRNIKDHNKKFARGWSSFELTVNSFTMMDMEERLKFTGLLTDNMTHLGTQENKDPVLGSSQLPDSFDWAEKGYVTGVKNQGSCASCWAYAAVGPLEYIYKKATGKLLALSEQELLDCTYEGSYKNGCDGGWYTNAWQIVYDHKHMASMNDYQYQGRDGHCSKQTFAKYKNQFANKVQLTASRKTERSESGVLSALISKGPLAVAIHTTRDFFVVGQGIFDGCPYKEKITHGLVLVGYGEKFFNVKNSWGRDWGDNGYVRMKRGRDICQLLSFAEYIEYKDLDPTDNEAPTPKKETDDKPNKSKNKSPQDKSYSDDGDCKDLEKWDCEEVKMNGNCYNPKVRWMGSRYCRKTCGLCGCTDYDMDCEEYDKMGYCDPSHMLYIAHTKKYCKKTCGICDPDKSSSTKSDSSSSESKKSDKKSSANGGCPDSLVWCKDDSDPAGGYCIHIHMCKTG